MLAPNAPLGNHNKPVRVAASVVRAAMSSVASMPGFRLMLPYRGPMQDMQRLAPEVRPAFWFRRAVLATEAQADPGGDGCLAPDIKLADLPLQPCHAACSADRPRPHAPLPYPVARTAIHPANRLIVSPPSLRWLDPFCATAHHGCGHNMLDF